MRHPRHIECYLRQIEQDSAYKALAAKYPHLVEKGKSELEEIGFRKSKSFFSFIRNMSRVNGTSACRPATRYKECAYYYVGEQLTTNKNFRDKFYKTKVSDDETRFIIDGKMFYSGAKSSKRAKKCNLSKNIEDYKDKIEFHFDEFSIFKVSDNESASESVTDPFDFNLYDQFEFNEPM
jgi:hypothetical protein